MATLRELAIAITARTGGFTRGVQNVLGGLGRLEQRTKRTNRGFSAMTRTFQALPGLIGIAGGGAVIRSIGRIGESFDQAMNQSLAIMSDVTPQLRQQMESVAIATARMSRASSEDAARSFFYLASAGLNAEQSIAALPTVARFATAGAFDMATATDLLTDAQSALGLTVKDSAQNMLNMTRIGDVLIKANTLANASAQQFSESLTNKAAAAARIVGKEIEEVVAVLAAFADQGLKGADAGTAINIVFRDLQSKALGNAQAFKKFGVNVYDITGDMRNMADIVKDLEDLLAGMSDAQAKATLMTLGFSDKSVIYLQTLIGMSEKIREYEAGVKKAGGTMQDVADKQLTPWQKAMSEINASMTQFGVALRPARDRISELASGMASGVKSLAQWIEQGPAGNETFQGITITILSLTAAVGGLTVALGLMLKVAGVALAVFTGMGTAVLLTLGAVVLLIDHMVALDRIYQKQQALRRQVRPGDPSPYFATGKYVATPEAALESQRILDAFRGPESAAAQLRGALEGPDRVQSLTSRLDELIAVSRETRNAIDGVGKLN